MNLSTTMKNDLPVSTEYLFVNIQFPNKNKICCYYTEQFPHTSRLMLNPERSLILSIHSVRVFSKYFWNFALTDSYCQIAAEPKAQPENYKYIYNQAM